MNEWELELRLQRFGAKKDNIGNCHPDEGQDLLNGEQNVL